MQRRADLTRQGLDRSTLPVQLPDRRFVRADALHFLVGYRTGRYAAHARIARYEIGPGFNPLRYEQTSDADWAVLTVIERLPAAIEPLRLRRELVPTGTK